MKIDHVGWVTNDIGKFEKFWVKILGFKKVWESYTPPEMASALFGKSTGARVVRYKKGTMTVECHIFDKSTPKSNLNFQKFGINHIALFVKNRKSFLKKYNFKTHIYHNPKGWDNMFIRDFEGNWIELRGKI